MEGQRWAYGFLLFSFTTEVLAWLLFDSSSVLHGRIGRSQVFPLMSRRAGGGGLSPFSFCVFFNIIFDMSQAVMHEFFFFRVAGVFLGNETAVRRVVSYLMLPTTTKNLLLWMCEIDGEKLPFWLRKTPHHVVVMTSLIYVCVYFEFVGMGCQTSAANGLGDQNAPCVRHLLWLLI